MTLWRPGRKKNSTSWDDIRNRPSQGFLLLSYSVIEPTLPHVFLSPLRLARYHHVMAPPNLQLGGLPLDCHWHGCQLCIFARRGIDYLYGRRAGYHPPVGLDAWTNIFSRGILGHSLHAATQLITDDPALLLRQRTTLAHSLQLSRLWPQPALILPNELPNDRPSR